MTDKNKKIKTNFLTRALLVATIIVVTLWGVISKSTWMSIAIVMFAINLVMLAYSWRSKSKAKGRTRYYDERIHNDVDRSARNGFIFLMLALTAVILIDGMGSYVIDLSTSMVELQLAGFTVYYLSRIKYSNSPF